jgi:uncharacterized membrane protein
MVEKSEKKRPRRFFTVIILFSLSLIPSFILWKLTNTGWVGFMGSLFGFSAIIFLGYYIYLTWERAFEEKKQDRKTDSDEVQT